MSIKNRAIELLIVEDNLPDVDLLKYLFEATQRAVNFHCAYDGKQGLEFLFKKGSYADCPTPDLVLLDLNLPLKDGRELLREIKADASLRRIPIIMLSTSNSPNEVEEAYSLGASAFISKPSDLDQFENTVRSLADFWFDQIDLPRAQ